MDGEGSCQGQWFRLAMARVVGRMAVIGAAKLRLGLV